MNAFEEYWRVLCLHIRMQLSLSAISAKGRKRSGKETWKLIGFGLLIAYAVGAVLLLYSFILFPIMRSVPEAEAALLAELGIQADLMTPMMGSIVLLCMVVVLIFGTLTLLSLVFGAKDAETFAALPLREQSVFAAKFSMAYGLELGVTALFLWPPVVIYGIVSGLPASGFALLVLRALPVWLLLPAVPMALAALISMLFTRLTALTKHRDALLMVFGMALVLGLTVGQAMLSGRMANVFSDGNKVLELLLDSRRLLETITGYIPPALWGSQALVGGPAEAGFGLLRMIASAAAGGAVCLLLSRRLYYKGVLAQLEAPKGKKKGYSKSSVKTGGALKAFFSKEVKVILRTPVYAMNILTGVAVFPLMFAALSVSQGVASGGIREMIRAIAGGGNSDVYYLLAAAAVMLTAAMSSVCVSTTFSREGRMLWIVQTAPVPAATQVAARLLCGFVLTAGGAVLLLALLVAFAGFSAPEVSFGFVAGLCTAFPMLTSAIIPDALKPKRKWNSEAEAIKQNMNSILALLINMGVAIAIGFAVVGLQTLIPVWAAVAAAAVGCLAAGYALFCYAVRITDGMMKTIDG